jgi:hypothetical protein
VLGGQANIQLRNQEEIKGRNDKTFQHFEAIGDACI